MDVEMSPELELLLALRRGVRAGRLRGTCRSR
jgi:hypothetical protein